MSNNKVIVTDISAEASEKTVRSFFQFAGKIKELELKKEENKQIAYITFEKEEAARTSLILSKSIMGESLIIVKPVDEVNNDDGYSEDEHQIKGKANNKSEILAEILAAGYQLQDTIYETGSGIDAKLGVTDRITQYLSHLSSKLQEINHKYKVVETVVHKATEIDGKFAVQDKVRSYATQAQDKATKALNTETGKYAKELYTNTYKQIGVIQFQARKIADDKKAKIGAINGGIEAH